MSQKLVTVVVPVYNVEKYLDRCLMSIVKQTYWNLEILLIEDGSPDACPEMCDMWSKRDHRIKVIHKKNEGLGMARNTGIEHASGDYICFFDSDDYVALDTIEKSVTLAQNEKAEIVVFGMVTVNSKGEATEWLAPESDKLCYRGADVQERFLADLIDNRSKDVKIKNLCLSACSCLFSTALIRRTGWEFVSERQIISEDSYSLIWLYQYVTCVAVIPETLYFYCSNASSLTRSYRADRFYKIKQFYDECMKLTQQIGYGSVISGRIAGLFLSFSITAIKQIVASELPYSKRRRLINQIISDETMCTVLSNYSGNYNGLPRRILFWAMQHKLNGLVYLLTKIQLNIPGQ